MPEDLRDDIIANDEIYDEVIGIDAPGCLRSSIVQSKNKNVAFTTKEEFDRAVQERSNDAVASVRKGFEEEMSKFKNEYCSTIEMLQSRLLTLEGHNSNVSEKSFTSFICVMHFISHAFKLINLQGIRVFEFSTNTSFQ